MSWNSMLLGVSQSRSFQGTESVFDRGIQCNQPVEVAHLPRLIGFCSHAPELHVLPERPGLRASEGIQSAKEHSIAGQSWLRMSPQVLRQLFEKRLQLSLIGDLEGHPSFSDVHVLHREKVCQ